MPAAGLRATVETVNGDPVVIAQPYMQQPPTLIEFERAGCAEVIPTAVSRATGGVECLADAVETVGGLILKCDLEHAPNRVTRIGTSQTNEPAGGSHGSGRFGATYGREAARS
jgi:hypothetical protein